MSDDEPQDKRIHNGLSGYGYDGTPMSRMLFEAWALEDRRDREKAGTVAAGGPEMSGVGGSNGI